MSFEAGIAQIRDLIGAEHVVVSPDEVEPLAADTLPEVRMPSAVLYPGSVDEVCAVVRVAHEQRLPIWPVSRGRNWGYGAATPSQTGTLVLSLERLNRIREVNTELAYAVVEPGVSYAQLHRHLKDKQIPLWIDPTDSTPHGSVLGNALDRGLGVNAYADHFGSLCGLEVVLADGRLIRTGGSVPDGVARHAYKWGTGPYVDGLFSQSSFGIVVSAGVWLMPSPDVYVLFGLEVTDEARLPAAVDALRRLHLAEVIRGRTSVGNDFLNIAMMSQRPRRPGSSHTALSEAELADRRLEHGLPRWVVSGGIYGTAEEVRAKRRRVLRALRPYGKVLFYDEARVAYARRLTRLMQRIRRLPGAAGNTDRLFRRLVGRSLRLVELLPPGFDHYSGTPTDYFLRVAYYKAHRPVPPADPDPARDGGGLIWYAPIAPFTGQHVSQMIALFRPLFREHDLDFAVIMMPLGPRAVAFILLILYDKASADETARAKALFARLVDVGAQAGYQRYRVGAPHADFAATQEAGYRDLLSAIKQAVDPHGIIAPGRYGIGVTDDQARRASSTLND
jgi:4-cresol dehydrogenase (hydroxylating)